MGGCKQVKRVAAALLTSSGRWWGRTNAGLGSVQAFRESGSVQAFCLMQRQRSEVFVHSRASSGQSKVSEKVGGVWWMFPQGLAESYPALGDLGTLLLVRDSELCSLCALGIHTAA